LLVEATKDEDKRLDSTGASITEFSNSLFVGDKKGGGEERNSRRRLREGSDDCDLNELDFCTSGLSLSNFLS
jgi:hypothetical protein